VPVSKGNSQNRLASFMVARADPAASPRLESLEMPTGLTVAGPVQVFRTINNTAAISKEFSLLNQQGSRVLQGSIQIIPVKDSLLYVQPVYVLSENGQQPAFRDVIVYYNGSAAIDKTLIGALNQFPAFSGIAPTAPTPDAGVAPQPPVNGTARATVDSLLKDANAAYDAAQTALKNQDLAGYQQQIQKLGDILTNLAKARAAEQGAATGSSTTSTTTTTTKPKASGTQALGPSR
jgi:uncharacterized membrane protein (UPF0182 family)